MAKKLISFDDTKLGTGLPDVVEERLGTALTPPNTLPSVYSGGYDEDLKGVFFQDSQFRLWRIGALLGAVERSEDGGATWENVFTFPSTVLGMRELDNGRILAGVAGPASGRSTLWISEGDGFVQKLESSGTTASFNLKWSGIGGNGIYTVSEYDSGAVGSRGEHQRAWKTVDGGNTWTEMYDHGTVGGHRHIHGVAYDKYHDAIWLTLGDNYGSDAGARGLLVSWDRGATWVTVSIDLQPTSIWPMPDCVIFGTDNAPNGILRIDHPSETNLHVKVTHKINDRNRLTHVGEAITQHAPGELILVPFSSALAGEKALVMASLDGKTFWEVWRASDDINVTWSYVLPGGDLLVRGTLGGSAVAVRVPMASGDPAKALPAQGASVNSPRRSFIMHPNLGGQAIPAKTWTTLELNPNPWGKDNNTQWGGHLNAEGLFVSNPETNSITVTRNAVIDVNALLMGPRAGANEIAINVSGNRTWIAVGLSASAKFPVRAGATISIQVYTSSPIPATWSSPYALSIEAWETV